MEKENKQRKKGIPVTIDVSKPLARIISDNYKLLDELANN